MNKKLRLLVTAQCPNKCPMCCNNSWDFSKLPVVDRWDYEQIMLTGGEPLMMVEQLIPLMISIRKITSAMGTNPKIYVYTAVCNSSKLDRVLTYADGIVLTPHNKRDISGFIEFNIKLNACNRLRERKTFYFNEYEGKSLRLNLFPDIKELLKDEDLSGWQVKDIHWIKDCPVPKGEDFRRINEPW